MKWLDLPPVWLAGCVGVAWLQASYLPMGLSFGGSWADLAGGLLVGAGIVMMLLALAEFRRHRTTVVPHKTPEKLIQTGIFTRSRNPIYLGDALILAGLVLRFDAVPSLALVPIFIWIIEKRFVLSEEDRMRREFRMEFARYERKTRRWL